jgi:cell division protein FtsI (penicillin-binding protein 3)
MAEDNFKYKEEIFKKTSILYFFILGFFILIILRLFQVMFVQKTKWEEVAKNYSIDYKSGKPERGDIYDDNGNLLATTIHYYDIHMDTKPQGLTQKDFNKNIDSLAIYLSKYFKDKTPSEYKKYITDARKITKKNSKGIDYEWPDRYLKIAIGQTYKTSEIVSKFPIFRKGRNGGGLIIEQRNIREKLLGDLMRRTIGIVTDETPEKASYGSFGLEYKYNRELSGVPGKVLKRNIGNGIWMDVPGGVIVPTQDGVDLITSIDIDLQDFVQDALGKQILKFGADHGTVIVMEVKTGRIKAMANLTLKKDSTVLEDVNFAVAEALEPGSTFKLPIIIAALEDNFIKITDSIETGNGYTEYFGKSVEDEGSYGNIPVWKVFAKSSNVGMSKIVYNNYFSKGKTDQLLRRLGNMGLHDFSGIDLDGEAMPFVNDPSYTQKWWKGSPMMMSHGYEIKLTPLQILTLYNAIANNGKMLQPSLVKAISNHGRIIKVFAENEIKSSICSKKTLKDVRFLLEKAVSEDGTAKELGRAKYRIAGKTGTAKVYDSKNKCYSDLNRTSFVGYFPADNPKYSCIVVIHEPKGANMFGSNVAAPLFLKISDKIYSKDFEINPFVEKNNKKRFIDIPVSKNGFSHDLNIIFSSILVNTQNQNIKKNSLWVITNTHKNSVEFVENKINKDVVPNVKYMGARDAVYLLESMGLEVIMSGKGFVKFQSITPGTKFNKGQKITIELA